MGSLFDIRVKFEDDTRIVERQENAFDGDGWRSMYSRRLDIYRAIQASSSFLRRKRTRPLLPIVVWLLTGCRNPVLITTVLVVARGGFG
jgi:hypothetical protein